MRITIGGILLVGGVVAVAVVGPFSNPGDLVKQAIDGVTSLVKSVSGPAVIPVPPTVPTDNAPVSSAVVTPAVSSATVATSSITHVSESRVVAATVTEKTAAPVPAPAAPKSVPEKRSRHKHRRLHRSKAVVAVPPSTPAPVKKAAAPAAAPAKSADQSDPLIGNYVAVKLKSGREVKGTLRAKTPQGITLEIPGMGPFQYPSSNIDGIKAAE